MGGMAFVKQEKVRGLTLRYMRERLVKGIYTGALSIVIITIFALLGGCDQQGVNSSDLPKEGPVAVLERFYGYISEAKHKGGGSPASAAFKMISSKRSRLIEGQFLEVIRGYPSGFAVTVGKAEIDGTQALVNISYKMPSMFDDGYTVDEIIPLTVDPATNTWLVDFTNETYGMETAEAKKIEATELARMK